MNPDDPAQPLANDAMPLWEQRLRARRVGLPIWAGVIPMAIMGAYLLIARRLGAFEAL